MGSRRVYEADSEVIEACRARGVEVTARQLERWRPLLPARHVEHAKGERGSRTVNPPGYVEQVIVIAEAIRARIPLRQVPLVLFTGGWLVEIEVLRASYLDVFTYLTREIDRVTTSAGPGLHDPNDQPDILAVRMAANTRRNRMFQRWEERAQRVVKSGQAGEVSNARSFFASVLSAALTGPVTGVAASSEGMSEALTVFGLNDGQDPGHVAEHLASVTFAAVGHAIRSATWEQFATARADLANMLRLAQTRSRVEARILPPSQQLEGLGDLSTDEPVSRAALIAGLLVIGNEAWRQDLHTELARWEALDQLTSVLPERLHRYLPEQQLPEEIIQELAPIVIRWAENHPAEANILIPNIG